MTKNDSGSVIRISDFSPEAIADSGQCFRMTSGTDGTFLIASGRELVIKRLRDGEFHFSCGMEEYEEFWRGYFDLDEDYGKFRETIADDDAFLKQAAEFGKGIRILRQDPFEMLISFIISQRKSVPAIRTSVDRLCRLAGTRIRDGVYAFPGPEAIACMDGMSLESCGLGYRLSYVREAAEKAASGELRLRSLSGLPSDELIAELMKLNGVGIKVASCIALFAYHRLEIMPVDVWMNRVIDTVYGGCMPDGYRPCMGVLQQYLFNYARINKTGVR